MLQQQIVALQNKNKELQKRIDSRDDNLFIEKQIKGELQKFNELQRNYQQVLAEKKELEKRVQNEQILREEIKSLQNKLQQHQAVQDRLLKLEFENASLVEKCNKWSSNFGNLSLDEAKNFVENLRAENFRLIQERDEVVSEKKRLLAALKEAETQVRLNNSKL